MSGERLPGEKQQGSLIKAPSRPTSPTKEPNRQLVLLGFFGTPLLDSSLKGKLRGP